MQLEDKIVACARIADPNIRLACFDREARGLGGVVTIRPRPDGNLIARDQPLIPVGQNPGTAASAAKPGSLERGPPAAASSEVAQPIQFRLAFGGGYGVGDHTGEVRVPGGRLQLASSIGNAGEILTGQAWIDNWLASDWSIGLEYLHLHHRTSAKLSLPHGVSILTDPINGTVGGNLIASIGMLNFAYHPNVSGHVRPFIGGGVGAGYAELTASYYAHSDFFGSLSNSIRLKSPFAGIQGFLGVEFDLFDPIYVSVMPRVIWVDGHPIGVNERYLDFSVSGLIGVRF